MLTLLVSITVAFLIYRNINTTLKNFVLQEISKKFPQVEVELGSISLLESKGVVLRSLRIFGHHSEGNERTLFEAEEVFIECPIEIHSFLRGEAVPQRIQVKKPKFFVTISENGTIWGLDLLQPSEDSQKKLVPIEILDAILCCQDLREKMPQISISGINAAIVPPGMTSDSEKKPSPFWTFTVSTSNSLVRGLALEGAFVPETADLIVNGKLQELRFSREYFPASDVSPQLAEILQSLQGKVDAEFSLGRNSTQLTDAPFGLFLNLKGRIFDGRVQVSLLSPKPITEISADFQVTHDSANVTNIKASTGETSLTANWQQSGLFPIRQGQLTSYIKDLKFNNDYIESFFPFLPEKAGTFLKNYTYEGNADVATILTLEKNHWSAKEVLAKLHDLSASYQKFPYKTDHLKGTIHISPEQTLTLDLKSVKEKQTISITGSVEHLNTFPQGSIEIVGTLIPVDEKLMKSIRQEQVRDVLEELHATGTITAFFRLTLPGDGLPMQPFLQLTVLDCSMQYEKFPYPLHNIRGIIEMNGDAWRFRDMNGRNGETRVAGNGYLAPAQNQSGGHEFRLKLGVEELEIGSTLTNAILNENQRELITNLNIKGMANLSDLDISYQTAEQKLNISFDAMFPHPKDTSIKPAHFPYRLENLQAIVHYRDGEVRVDRFSGQNNATTVSGGILCLFAPDGSWQLHLNRLLAEQVYHDQNLYAAIPVEIRDLTEQLNIKGAVTLQGDLLFTKGASPNDLMVSSWNLGLLCLQNKADIGVPISNISGKVHLLGRNDGKNHCGFGELSLDAATYGDYLLTEIRGPFSFHDRQFDFGQNAYIPKICTTNQISLLQFSQLNFPFLANDQEIRQTSFERMMSPLSSEAERPGFASSRQNAQPIEPEAMRRPVSAKLFGGNAIARGTVFYTPNVSYNIGAQVEQIDLETATMEMMATNKTKGKISGFVNLIGEGRSRDSMKGAGQLQLSDADIYQFPVMAALSKSLRLTPEKDQTGISSCNVSFQLQGNKAVLDPISLDGNSFSLTGKGDMNIDTTDVYMLLGVRLGNSATRIPGFSDALGEAGDKLLSFSVTGSLSDGKIAVKRETLSGIRSSLLQIPEQSETSNRPVLNFFRNPLRGLSGTLTQE